MRPIAPMTVKGGGAAVEGEEVPSLSLCAATAFVRGRNYVTAELAALITARLKRTVHIALLPMGDVMADNVLLAA